MKILTPFHSNDLLFPHPIFRTHLISLSRSLRDDSDWNPQNDLLAQARAHRIGQTKPVKVYRLLTRKTYETVMFRAASIKLGLDYAVMHNMQGQGGAVQGIDGVGADRVENVSALSKKELENLLKHGPYRTVPCCGAPYRMLMLRHLTIFKTLYCTTITVFPTLFTPRYLDSYLIVMLLNCLSFLPRWAPLYCNVSLLVPLILSLGAYDIFREEKDGQSLEESNRFCEADIDQILSRSAVVIHDTKKSG